MHAVLRATLAAAEEQRLTQLSDDNAFVDTASLRGQRLRGVGADGGSEATAGDGFLGHGTGRGRPTHSSGASGGSAVDGVADGATATRGQGKLNLTHCYYAQHRAYTEMWARAWSAAEEEIAEQTQQQEDAEARAAAGSKQQKKAAKTARARGRPGDTSRKRARKAAEADRGAEGNDDDEDARGSDTTAATALQDSGDQTSPRALRYLRRGERPVMDERDVSSLTASLAEECRLLAAWRAVQAGLDGVSSSSGLVAPPSDAPTASLPVKGSSRTVAVAGRRRGTVAAIAKSAVTGLADPPLSIAPSVLAALLLPPSRLATTAPPPVALSADSRRSGSEQLLGWTHIPVGAVAVQQEDGPGVTPSFSVAPCPCTLGAGGHHLCAVCLKPAAYRCVRCKTALFCSIDCHVVHDATRCLKFTV